MKQIITFILFLVFMATNASAQRSCPVCHGNKKIQTQRAMATYGVSVRRTKCQYCQRIILSNEEHWDICYKCNGTGKVQSTNNNYNNNNNSRIDRNRDQANDFLSYLDPQDIAAYNNLVQQRMKGTKLASVTCHLCNGSGICRGCRGTGVLFGDSPCVGCYGTGWCNQCGGRKQQMVEVPLSQQEIADLDRLIKVYVDKAMNRRNR